MSSRGGNLQEEEASLPTVLANNAVSFAMVSMIALLPSGAVADEALLYNPTPGALTIAAVTLPDGWTSSTTAEGREFYYNSQTKESQWELPKGATDDGAKAVKRKKSGDLREVVGFEAPVIPIDKVTKKDAPKLVGKCGEEDFRVNSVECAPEKMEAGKPAPSKAEAADQRYRMLQAAEMKSLEKTKLFQDLAAKTKDPERTKKREADIERITAQNDVGSIKAPWTSDSDRPPPARLELPKIELPKLPEVKLPKLF